jgi:hypothetical protein
VLEVTAAHHTPGFFRDSHRQKAAQASLNPAFAATSLRLHVAAEPLDVPTMLRLDRVTLAAVREHILAAHAAMPGRFGAVREHSLAWLTFALGLDPSLDALARDGWAVASSTPGAAAFAAQAILSLAATHDGDERCSRGALAASSWDRGEPEVAWVAEVCWPAEEVGGYCEPDLWREGRCWDEWINEDCDNGRWVDRGYYEYVCRSDGDCRYVWRSAWRYEGGDCAGGYYQRHCDPGYWERGLCYDGTYVPEYCIEGHYEYRYSGGTWTHPVYMTTPQVCEAVRPGQLGIAFSAVRALKAHLYDDLPPELQAATDRLLSDVGEAPQERHLDAAYRLLEAASRMD